MQQYEIKDNISPYLRKLFAISEGLGLQALSKSGHEIRKMMAVKSRSLGSHKYGQKIVNGRRVLVDTRGGQSKPFYSRVSHTEDKKEADMGELIRYKLYEHSLTMLVGWINVKSYNTTFYKGGVAHKGNRVQGTKTKEIARMMAEGGRVQLTDNQKKLFKRSGWGKAASRGYVNRKAHPFMNFSHYIGTAHEVARREFKNAVHQFEQSA